MVREKNMCPSSVHIILARRHATKSLHVYNSNPLNQSKQPDSIAQIYKFMALAFSECCCYRSSWLMKANYAPILLFVYSRPNHTMRTIEALLKNPEAELSDLYIYSDASKDEAMLNSVQEVRAYIKQVRGFKSVTIIEREKNWGLANSIIDGVTRTLSQFDRVIVLEDDIVTNPNFLRYMNNALIQYDRDERVACIHGFVFPIPNLPETFFLKGTDCWGWATWARAWKIFNPNGSELLTQLERRGLESEFNFNDRYPNIQMLKDQIAGKNSSWAVRWHASAFLKEKLCLYPGKTLVKNIGFDIGTHGNDGEDHPIFGRMDSSTEVIVKEIPVVHNEYVFEKFGQFLKNRQPSIPMRVFNKFKRTLKKITQRAH